MGVIGQIYMNQKKILISQEFYDETRFLMEKLTQIARNNTIDYDRYFEEVGPEDTTECINFDEDQLPKSYKTASPANSLTNNLDNRKKLKYSEIFYWDTNDDGKQDRNLGGMKPDGQDPGDPCAKAWHITNTTTNTLDELYLINGAKDLRTAIKFVEDSTNGNHIEIQQEIGQDTDGDARADTWSAHSEWADPSTCNIYKEAAHTTNLGTITTTKKICRRAHPWTQISHPKLIVDKFEFRLTPDRKPHLNFRIDTAQIHPSVHLTLQTKLDDEFTIFEPTKIPTIYLQTVASSRVFGQ